MTIKTLTPRRLRLSAGLALAIFCLGMLVPGEAAADYRGYSYGKSYGGGYHGGYNPTPAPAPVNNTTTSSRRTVSVSNQYRDGDSGVSWLRFGGRGNSNNGYRGSNISINTPHRSDWESKITAQRQWDEAQMRQAQQRGGKGTECGFTTSPAYCYKLNSPYPQVMKVVRY